MTRIAPLTNNARARVCALGEPIHHGYHINGCEYCNYVWISIASSKRESAPYSTKYTTKGTSDKILKVTPNSETNALEAFHEIRRKTYLGCIINQASTTAHQL